MRGEKVVVGRAGMSGWVVIEVASGEREEEMRVLAAACSASVGARSTSGFAWLAWRWKMEEEGCYRVNSRGILLLEAFFRALRM